MKTESSSSGSAWFLVSLLPIVGFLFTQFSVWSFFDRYSKTSEALVFYIACTISLIFLTWKPAYFFQERFDAWGRLQTLGSLAILFVWGQMGRSRPAVSYLALMTLILISWSTLPAIFGWRKSFSRFEHFLLRHFPKLVLGLAVAGANSVSMYPLYEGVTTFFAPLISGALAIALALLLEKTLPQFVSPLRWKWVIFISLFLLVGTIPCFTQINYYHLSSFLGPVIQDFHGRTLIIQTESQYGIGGIWFLTLICRLLGRVSWSDGYWMGYFFMLFNFLATPLLIWMMIKDRLALVIGLLVAIAFGVWGYIPAYYSYLSLGPHRFGFYIFFLFTILLRRCHPRLTSITDWADAVMIGIAATWSTEVAAFAILPYLAVLANERRLFRSGWKSALMILVSFGLAEFKIHAQTGQYVPLAYFWEYVRINTVDGASSAPIERVGTWITLWWILTASVAFVWIEFLRKKADSVFVLLTATLFVTMSYFVNRSLDLILLPFAPFLSLLVVYYLFIILPRRSLAYSLAFVALVTAHWLNSPIYHLPGGPRVDAVLYNYQTLFRNLAKLTQGTPWPISNDPCSEHRPQIEFVGRHMANQSSLYFLGTAGDADTLNLQVPDTVFSICLNKPNEFNLNPAEVTSINPRATSEKTELMLQRKFLPGQKVIVAQSFMSSKPFVNAKWAPYRMYLAMTENYRLTPIETVGGYTAVRLDKK